MANEITLLAPSGRTVYTIVRNGAAQLWNTSSGAFETYASAHWSAYALALTEQGQSGFYSAAFPSAITTAGRYHLDLRQQAGGTPQLTDSGLGGGDLIWSGSAEALPPLTNASGQVQHDLTQAVPTSNTAQTVGDALNAARACGFGKWVLNGAQLQIFAADGTTVVRQFTLDNALNPTQRT